METILKGFRYSIPNIQNPANSQTIQFVHNEYNETYKEDVIIKDGITDIALMEMFRDRVEFLTERHPDSEELAAIHKRFNTSLKDFQKIQDDLLASSIQPTLIDENNGGKDKN